MEQQAVNINSKHVAPGLSADMQEIGKDQPLANPRPSDRCSATLVIAAKVEGSCAISVDTGLCEITINRGYKKDLNIWGHQFAFLSILGLAFSDLVFSRMGKLMSRIFYATAVSSIEIFTSTKAKLVIHDKEPRLYHAECRQDSTKWNGKERKGRSCLRLLVPLSGELYSRDGARLRYPCHLGFVSDVLEIMSEDVTIQSEVVWKARFAETKMALLIDLYAMVRCRWRASSSSCSLLQTETRDQIMLRPSRNWGPINFACFWFRNYTNTRTEEIMNTLSRLISSQFMFWYRTAFAAWEIADEFAISGVQSIALSSVTKLICFHILKDQVRCLVLKKNGLFLDLAAMSIVASGILREYPKFGVSLENGISPEEAHLATIITIPSSFSIVFNAPSIVGVMGPTAGMTSSLVNTKESIPSKLAPTVNQEGQRLDETLSKIYGVRSRLVRSATISWQDYDPPKDERATWKLDARVSRYCKPRVHDGRIQVFDTQRLSAFLGDIDHVHRKASKRSNLILGSYILREALHGLLNATRGPLGSNLLPYFEGEPLPTMSGLRQVSIAYPRDHDLCGRTQLEQVQHRIKILDIYGHAAYTLAALSLVLMYTVLRLSLDRGAWLL
ncbi:uncharacterized protein BDR25DRAFT_351355 [Lindgomyces ingoldianus]|uniref:Uncharacterized protein n=1 Tax=Lindgomyces ingoldianus TaxID=673940 RepID=A0ACB6R6H0_9PLEO|nr:uncharacterized protein BDR25DRAFT_351355 [Lindgomyces ingoldianus]KAF2474853.1 hypothetical protein BDR25DRAFT_351355 [Lindgomyces ingoldianus]